MRKVSSILLGVPRITCLREQAFCFVSAAHRITALAANVSVAIKKNPIHNLLVYQITSCDLLNAQVDDLREGMACARELPAQGDDLRKG